MGLLIFLILLAAFALFLVDTWRTHSLVSAGLALWVLTFVVAAWPG